MIITKIITSRTIYTGHLWYWSIPIKNTVSDSYTRTCLALHKITSFDSPNIIV